MTNIDSLITWRTVQEPGTGMCMTTGELSLGGSVVHAEGAEAEARAAIVQAIRERLGGVDR